MTLSFTETDNDKRNYSIRLLIWQKYFWRLFPKLLYDIDNTKLVTDIFRRIKAREQLHPTCCSIYLFSGEQPGETTF